MLEEGAQFSFGSPEEEVYAAQSLGKPLWLYARDGCNTKKLRELFIRCLQKKRDLSGLITTGWAAGICRDLCPPVTASWEIAAFYLPKLLYKSKKQLIFPSKKDVGTISGWIREFYMEALSISPALDADERMATALVEAKIIYGLEEEGFGLVVMGMAIPVADMSRLNLIYCPPAYRGRGFGKDIVAAISAKIQNWNQLPVLYARAENKIVMDMYKSLGFVEAGRLLELRF